MAVRDVRRGRVFRSIRRSICVFLGLVLVLQSSSLVHAKQDLTETTCPLCDMYVKPYLNASILGKQYIYACEMAGHINTLAQEPTKHLGPPQRVDITKDDVYRDATDIECPVCGKPHGELKYAVPWVSQGDQKIFACSQEHAQMIFDNPTQYVAAMDGGDGFCDAGSALEPIGSVMFEGFQVAIGGNMRCAMLLFQPWVLNSAVKYAIAFIAVTLLAVSLEAFGEYREYMETTLYKRYGIVSSQADCVEMQTPTQMVSSYHNKGAIVNEPSVKIIRRIPFWCKLVLAVLYMVAITVAYLLMLVIMMYETSMFFAVVLGLGIGFFLFKDTEGDVMSGNVDPCCST